MKFKFVFVIVVILLASLSCTESSFAYSGFLGHCCKALSHKVKPTHSVSFSFICDSGKLQSLSFRVYQINIRSGFDTTINVNSVKSTTSTLNLPDGGYIVIASGHITSGGGYRLVEGQAVFGVNGKDQSFNIKLKPLEGMA